MFFLTVVDSSCSVVDVTSTLGRNVKTGALRLSSDKVCFVISEKGPLAMNLWCELTQVRQVWLLPVNKPN